MKYALLDNKVDRADSFSKVDKAVESYAEQWLKDANRASEAERNDYYSYLTIFHPSAFSQRLADLAAEEFKDDPEAAWEAAQWISATLSSFQVDANGPDSYYDFNVTLGKEAMASKLLDLSSLGRIISNKEGTIRLGTVTVNGEDVSDHLDAVAVENPFGNDIRYTVERLVRFNLNGMGGSSETIETWQPIGEELTMPSLEENPSCHFVGWSQYDRWFSNSYMDEFSFIGSDTIVMNDDSYLDLYAFYVSVDVSNRFQDFNGNDNGQANAGEGLNFYPFVENTGNLPAVFTISFNSQDMPTGISMSSVGNTAEYATFQLDPGYIRLVAGEDGSTVSNINRVNDSYFKSRYPDNRYRLFLSRNVADGPVGIPVRVDVRFDVPGIDSCTLEASSVIDVVSSPFKARISSFRLDDSMGNGDGYLNPGETVKLDVVWSLDPSSDDAYRLSSRLISSSPDIRVDVSTARYDEMEKGSFVTQKGVYNSSSEALRRILPVDSGAFQVTASSDMDAGSIPMTMRLTNSLGQVVDVDFSLVVRPVNARVVLEKWGFVESAGDKDGSVDPGETIHVGYVFRNSGQAGLDDPRIEFSCDNDGVSLSGAVISANMLSSGNYITTRERDVESATSTGVTTWNGLTVSVGKDYIPGSPIVINWKVTGEGSGAAGWSGSFEIPVVSVKSKPVISETRVFDSREGNGDGIASPGEGISVDMAVTNVGESGLQRLGWTFSSDSDYLDIIQPGQASYTNLVGVRRTLMTNARKLAIGSSYSFTEGDVVFKIHPDTPAGTAIPVTVTFTDGTNTWLDSFDIEVALPDSKLSVTAYLVVDDIDGDGLPDSGETCYVDFSVFNDGSSAVDVSAVLESQSPELVILNGSHDFGRLPAGMSKSISSDAHALAGPEAPLASSPDTMPEGVLSFKVADDAVPGSPVSLVLTLSNGYEDFPITYSFRTGDAGLPVEVDAAILSDLVVAGGEVFLEAKVMNTSDEDLHDLVLTLESGSPYLTIPPGGVRTCGCLGSGWCLGTRPDIFLPSREC